MVCERHSGLGVMYNGMNSRKDRLHMLPRVSAFAFVVSCSEI